MLVSHALILRLRLPVDAFDSRWMTSYIEPLSQRPTHEGPKHAAPFSSTEPHLLNGLPNSFLGASGKTMAPFDCPEPCGCEFFNQPDVTSVSLAEILHALILRSGDRDAS